MRMNDYHQQLLVIPMLKIRKIKFFFHKHVKKNKTYFDVVNSIRYNNTYTGIRKILKLLFLPTYNPRRTDLRYTVRRRTYNKNNNNNRSTE